MKVRFEDLAQMVQVLNDKEFACIRLIALENGKHIVKVTGITVRGDLAYWQTELPFSGLKEELKEKWHIESSPNEIKAGLERIEKLLDSFGIKAYYCEYKV